MATRQRNRTRSRVPPANKEPQIEPKKVVEVEEIEDDSFSSGKFEVSNSSSTKPAQETSFAVPKKDVFKKHNTEPNFLHIQSDKRTQENSDEKVPEVPIQKSPPLRLLDRYKQSTPRATSIFHYQPKTRHYIVRRDTSWIGAVPRRTFTMYKMEKREILASADFSGAFSKEIKVANSRGLVCELDTGGEKGKMDMRLGNDIVLSIVLQPGRAVHAEFFEFDGIQPSHEKLTSPPACCEDLKAAFGERKAIKSVKNCKLGVGGVEMIAVRKVSKDEVEVDTNPQISFLSAFAVAIFMFIS